MADLLICAIKMTWPRALWVNLGLNKLVLSSLVSFGCQAGKPGDSHTPFEAAIQEIGGVYRSRAPPRYNNA